MKRERRQKIFALCVENRDCEDIEKRKIYQVVPDAKAAKEGYIRIIDESGEGYLYPSAYFVSVQIPIEAQEVLREAR